MSTIPRMFLPLVAFLTLSVFLIAPRFAHATYRYEGVDFYADIAASTDNTPVNRFWSDEKQGHFYTISEEEKNHIIANYPERVWKYEGIAYYAYSASQSGTTAVYRFWSDEKQGHFYTISEEEKNHIIANYPERVWKYEGIAYYAYSTPQSGTAAVHRFWSDEKQGHFYTASEIEKSYLMNGNLGPDITVGLWSVTRDGSKADPFKIRSDQTYRAINKDGKTIASFPAGSETLISYDDDKKLAVKNGSSEILFDRLVAFGPENDSRDVIFDVSRPSSSFDRYRGKISIRYSDTSKKLWLINTLPLEQYIWGIGEITGTGDQEYNKTMTTAFRTYGLWKILYSTKYASEGFVIDATPGNQIYNGYDWEKNYPRIREAAQYTLGSIAKHGDDIALTPYSSWTDGRTRSFLERWGSTTYPWCQSVPDPYGKHPSLSTTQLETQGNHMVGISAHGALSLASNHAWDWKKILQYYLSNISILSAY